MSACGFVGQNAYVGKNFFVLFGVAARGFAVYNRATMRKSRLAGRKMKVLSKLKLN